MRPNPGPGFESERYEPSSVQREVPHREGRLCGSHVLGPPPRGLRPAPSGPGPPSARSARALARSSRERAASRPGSARAQPPAEDHVVPLGLRKGLGSDAKPRLIHLRIGEPEPQ